MFNRLLTIIFVSFGILGCYKSKDYSLDSSIPRIQTPTAQIGYIRTKFLNDRHIETVYFDNQNRVLEEFQFGRTNAKIKNNYKGKQLISTINYHHSDSSERGSLYIDTVYNYYDSENRLIMDHKIYGSISRNILNSQSGYIKRYLDYSINGDTIITKREESYVPDSSHILALINNWEHDNNKRLTRHYYLYVMKKSNLSSKPDTMTHFSQRFEYGKNGKLKMAWYDYMHLRPIYLPEGPDTTHYQYNDKNQLIREERIYSTNMSNKDSIDTSQMLPNDKFVIDLYKKRYFEDTNQYFKNNRTDVVTYQYEQFDPKKHLPLHIPDPEY